ncbi:MAG: RimK/LysX family protein [Planctomycetota bacterium]
MPNRKIRNIKDLPVIGWREWIGLPDFGVKNIKVKVDTGARSSAIHVFDLKEFDRDGSAWVKFKIHPQQRKSDKTILCEAKILDYREIRSSSGVAVRRPVIQTTIRLLNETLPVELTLANRDQMGFRMLLGRQAVRHHFIVDPGGSYYGGKPKRKKKAQPNVVKGKK